MKRIIRNISYLLFVFALLPVLSGCDNEDDVIEIFTGKTWKLSRLTTEGSSAPFYSGLWSSDEAMNASLKAFDVAANFTLVFQGSELDGQLLGTKFNAQGIKESLEGTWNIDGKSLTFSEMKTDGSENDPLGKAFINGLQNVYKYEGDTNSLTLYFKDGQSTKVMGFKPQ
ncbi:DUF4847 family protein [Bacteroides sp. GD17]|jgi:hypothetical protein|uniref:DUF4847 family protein n=1 Tax=Bacteroides sp. GD17 TaxID=3139826 RepID=UPI0025E6FDB3|nr:DUF4847 family protein [uncultured Bacteroides sp.]